MNRIEKVLEVPDIALHNKIFRFIESYFKDKTDKYEFNIVIQENNKIVILCNRDRLDGVLSSLEKTELGLLAA